MAAVHGGVASAIGAQVEQMILQAKKDSEARVRHELNVARTQLTHMQSLIGELTERVSRHARAKGPGSSDPTQTVDRAFLREKIAQLEQKWGSEVKALKQDLHRTILAHNHNSDLIRHHRDALDEARRKMDTQTHPKADQVDAQIEKVDRMLRAGQAKQRALDTLTERLAVLEQQVSELLPAAAMPPAFAGMIPGMTGMPGMASALGVARPPVSSKPCKKDGEPPSEEEVRARLLQASKGQSADSSTSFNAEAPVFVPRATNIEGSSGVTSPSSVAASPQAGTEGAEAKKEEDAQPSA